MRKSPRSNSSSRAKGQARPPLVGVIMGSKSDWETMRHADEQLTHFGIAHECRIVSAHRTPHRMAAYAKEAEGRGIREGWARTTRTAGPGPRRWRLPTAAGCDPRLR